MAEEYKVNNKVILRFMKETGVYGQWLDEIRVTKKIAHSYHDKNIIDLIDGKTKELDCVISYTYLINRIRKSKDCPYYFKDNVTSSLFRVFYKIVYFKDFANKKYNLKERMLSNMIYETKKIMNSPDFVKILKETGAINKNIDTLTEEILRIDNGRHKKTTSPISEF